MRPALVLASLAVALLAGDGAGRAEAADRFVTVAPGVEVFVHEEGRGTPVIVLHDGPGLDSNYLAPDLAPLAKSHRVIYYDQRGSGRSTLTPNVTADQLVADLEALRRGLGLSRVALLGHSWGGGLAALYALSHPDRVTRLVLVDSIPPNIDGIEGFGSALRDRLTTEENTQLRDAAAARDHATTDEQRVDACQAYRSILLRAYYADPDAAARSRGRPCASSGAALTSGREVNASVFDSLGEFDWRPKLAGLRVPTLILHGENDPIPLDTAREWQKALAGSRLMVLPKSGHMSYVEQPELFFRAVDTFLAGRWPADAH